MPLHPVRKIRPSSRSITGKRSSLKTNVTHQFESTLERDFLTLLEYDDTVEDYGVQPVTIYYEHNNKTARYTPDMLVYYTSEVNKKPLLVEIKYEADLKKDWLIYEPKFNAAHSYASHNGLQFRVFTEKQIRTDYLRNIKFLSRYHHGLIAQNDSKNLLSELLKRKVVTPIELLTKYSQEEKAGMLYTIWQMLAQKIISCDMQQPITMTTGLWITTNLA